MIQPKLSGRLGNFLFQVAAAYAYSLRHKMDYNVEPIGGGVENGTIEKYLSWFPNIKTGNKLRHGHAVFTEPSHAYTEIPYHENIEIIGYFQSELYFKDYESEIKSLFGIFNETKKGIVSIHVRRGDYVKYYTQFPPVDRRYLYPAVNFFRKRGYTNFLVFSDDIEHCKGILNSSKFNDCKFEYSDGKNEYEDLSLMSSCEHNIIANSSFSWWGAWLNNNPNKIVVSPHERPGNWYGERVKLDTSDMIPNTWYKIMF